MVENNYQLLFLEDIQVKNKIQDFLGQWKDIIMTMVFLKWQEN